MSFESRKKGEEMDVLNFIKSMHSNNKKKRIIREFSDRMKADLSDNLVSMRLFGSQARGEAREDSDIDVLIILKRRDFINRDKIYKMLFELDPYYEYKISLSIFSEEEYKKNEQSGSFFVENINREAVAL